MPSIPSALLTIATDPKFFPHHLGGVDAAQAAGLQGDGLGPHLLKLSGASSGESSIPKEGILNIIRSLAPRHSAGHALAAGLNCSSGFSYDDGLAALSRRNNAFKANRFGQNDTSFISPRQRDERTRRFFSTQYSWKSVMLRNRTLGVSYQ